MKVRGSRRTSDLIMPSPIGKRQVRFPLPLPATHPELKGLTEGYFDRIMAAYDRMTDPLVHHYQRKNTHSRLTCVSERILCQSLRISLTHDFDFLNLLSHRLLFGF